MYMLSKNGVGLVGLVLSIFGLEVSESQIIEVISALGTIVSFALMVWNQLDRKDVKHFIFKE